MRDDAMIFFANLETTRLGPLLWANGDGSPDRAGRAIWGALRAEHPLGAADAIGKAAAALALAKPRISFEVDLPPAASVEYPLDESAWPLITWAASRGCRWCFIVCVGGMNEVRMIAAEAYPPEKRGPGRILCLGDLDRMARKFNYQ